MAESEDSKTGRRRRRSRDQPPAVSGIRLVLVGITGAGKSSSGNTILGRDAFTTAVNQSSVTRQCCKKKGEVFSREVTIIDTPGLFDTALTDDAVKREIPKCINMSAPGPHAILLVIKVGPFTDEERDAVSKVEEIFGKDAWRYTIILFTHGDRVKVKFDQLVKEAGPELQEVLKKVENRYHVFNNLKTNDRGQVLDLLDQVDNMVAANGGRFYSNYTYEEVVKMLDQREEELRKFYENKLKEEIEAVERKYKKKLREAQHECQQVDQRLQAELQELKHYYHALESRVRHVVEQTADSSDEMMKKFHETLRLN